MTNWRVAVRGSGHTLWCRLARVFTRRETVFGLRGVVGEREFCGIPEVPTHHSRTSVGASIKRVPGMNKNVPGVPALYFSSNEMATRGLGGLHYTVDQNCSPDAHSSHSHDTKRQTNPTGACRRRQVHSTASAQKIHAIAYSIPLHSLACTLSSGVR